MPTVKNYYIGSGVSADYNLLQNWWRDFTLQGSGDLVSQDIQVNAYLMGGQLHPIVTGIPPGYDSTPWLEKHTHFFAMMNDLTVTDATHYFNIAAEPGYEFYGTFDNPQIPALTCSGGTRWTSMGGIFCTVPYTRMQGFIVKDINFNLNTRVSGFFVSNSAFGILNASNNSVIDRIGVQNLVSSQNSSLGTRVYGIYNVGDDTQVRNCIINDIFCSSYLGYSQSIGLAARYNSQIFNNTVSNISGSFYSPTGFVVGVGWPTIGGETVLPPDENFNIAQPEMWFDASVGPFYSGERANNAPATGLNIIIGRWNSLVNNYSGINQTTSNWNTLNYVGKISNQFSPTNLKCFEQRDNSVAENFDPQTLLRTLPIAGGWANGYTVANTFMIQSPDIYSANSDSGFIVANVQNQGSQKIRQFMGLCYTFNNITGTIHGQIRIGYTGYNDGVYVSSISVGPVFTGVWYAATLTADPNNFLLANTPKFYLEVQNVGSASGDLSNAVSYWSAFSDLSQSGSRTAQDFIIGGSWRITPENFGDLCHGEILLYRNPQPESGNVTAGRNDLRRYLYNKWIATSGGSYITPTVPSGALYINNYVGTITGVNTNYFICMGTGTGPVPSSNAVSDFSLVTSNGNLVNKSPTAQLTSNNRLSFNPSLLTSSELYNAGTNLSGDYGFNYDMAGEQRVGTWDIGADELFINELNNSPYLYIHGHENFIDVIPLYASGDNNPNSNIPLSIPQIFPYSGSMNLFVRNAGVNFSGNRSLYIKAITGLSGDNLNLTILGPGSTNNNNIPLSLYNYIDPSSLNLSMIGNIPSITGQLSLLLQGGYYSNTPLYMSGYGGVDSKNLSLSIYNFVDPSSLNLFIGGGVNDVASGISLLLAGGHNNSLPLYMSGYGYEAEKSLNMALMGNLVVNTGQTLFIDGQSDYRKLNLYLFGGFGHPAQDLVPMYINGDVAYGMNLYIKGPPTDEVNNTFNLYINSEHLQATSTTPLYIRNEQAGTSGWGAISQGLNMFMARDSIGQAYHIPLVLYGGINNSGNVNMVTLGGVGSTGTVNFYINGLPNTGELVKMYVRGF